MVTETSVNQTNSESSKMFVHKVLSTESAMCVCLIVSPISEPRFEPRLEHYRIRRRVHEFIEKERFNQIICHTRPYHMQWTMFQLLREMGNLL